MGIPFENISPTFEESGLDCCSNRGSFSYCVDISQYFMRPRHHTGADWNCSVDTTRTALELQFHNHKGPPAGDDSAYLHDALRKQWRCPLHHDPQPVRNLQLDQFFKLVRLDVRPSNINQLAPGVCS